MKLIVEIDDEIYKTWRREGKYASHSYAQKIILNGTPLPKGHGRLGDFDALEKEIINGIKAGNYEEGYEEYPHINSMDDCIEAIEYADIIIEADKEG